MIFNKVLPIATQKHLTEEQKEELRESGIDYFVENYFLDKGVLIEDIIYPENSTVGIDLIKSLDIEGVQIYSFILIYINKNNEEVIVPGVLSSANLLDREFLKYLIQKESILLPIVNYLLINPEENNGSERELLAETKTYKFQVTDSIKEVAKDIENADLSKIFMSPQEEYEFFSKHELPDPRELFYLFNKEAIDALSDNGNQEESQNQEEIKPVNNIE